MTELEIYQLLVSLGSYLTAILFVATLAFLILKETSYALMAGITWLFFFLGTQYYPYLIAWDVERIYRYPIWILHDFTWMAIIAYLGIKDRIAMWQSIYCQLLALPLLFLNFFRAIDVQLLEVMFTTPVYRSLYPVCETAIVLLCVAPIFHCVKRKIGQQNSSDRSANLVG